MQQKILNGRYELERKVGEGGMARVYLGRDLRLSRAVAIKVLHSQYASDPSFIARFNHEAQAAANLRHPNIIDIYDVGQDDDIPYIVMEYVEGQDLKALLRLGGPLPIERAVEIAEQVASGLDAAHRAGLVHRDVKPQNIIISTTGVAKITDFGIAKSALSTSATETGVIFGTADYLSPEQARGLVATPASDIYSLGITLYEMLTARLPFSGENSVAVAMQHVSAQPPAPSSYNPRIPPQLENIILGAIEKDPARRPPSARAFAQMLQGYRRMGDQGTVVRTVPVPQQQLRQQQPRQQPAESDTVAYSPRPVPRPRPVTMPPTNRSLPPRPSIPEPAPRSSGLGFGGFLLGLLLIVGVIALVGALASGGLAGLMPSLNFQTPSYPTSAPAGEPTAAPIQGTAVPQVPAPQLLGLSREQALQALANQGLRPYEEQPKNSDSVADGQVMQQNPPAGQLIDATGVVSFAISLGPEVVVVTLNDLSKLREAVAVQQLQDNKLVPNVTYEQSDTVQKGFVIRQDPPAGYRLAAGDTVDLVVSTGNEFTMPDLAGMTEEQAKQRIAELGLAHEYTDYQGCDKLGDLCNRYGPGVVVSSVPGVGATVKRGDAVTLGVRQP